MAGDASLSLALVENPGLTYAELVTIILTGITVVLAILAIFVAGLAIWGYESIKNEAGGVAKRAVEQTVAESVRSRVNDESVQAMVKKELQRQLRRSVMDAAFLYPQAFTKETGEADAQPEAKPTPIGEEYPEDKV